MSRTSMIKVIALSLLHLQAAAQLQSCSDINCPTNGGLTKCRVENVTLNALGVANFTSALSSQLLTWTLGYVNNINFDTASLRNYYLGTPQGLTLNDRTDVTGCALFFTGVEAGLSFIDPQQNQTTNADEVIGTCADALGASCESDLLSQARNLTSESTSSGDGLCSDLARDLQLALPKSCTKVRSWGNITAKVITGSESPSALQLNDCTPTISNTYTVREIASFPQTFVHDYFRDITPLLTVFVPTNGGSEPPSSNTITGPEAHLSCMKPITNHLAGQTGATGGAMVLSPSSCLAIAGMMVLNLAIWMV